MSYRILINFDDGLLYLQVIIDMVGVRTCLPLKGLDSKLTRCIIKQIITLREPEKYKPSCWYNIPNNEAFSAFSLGMLFSNSLVYYRFFVKMF